MVKNPPDEIRFSLASLNIFKGDDAQVGDPRTIQKSTQQNQSAVEGITRQHNINSACHIAKLLPERQAFESTLNAQAHFPEVFNVSLAGSANRKTSEAEVTGEEARTLRDITEVGRPSGDNKIRNNAPPTNRDNAQPLSKALGKRSLPSLYPVYRCQHDVLVAIQSLVEEACFEFAKAHFPNTLSKDGWGCPEYVESNLWPKILNDQLRGLPTDARLSSREPIGVVFAQLCELRHKAVRRLRTTANGIEKSIDNAELFLVDVLKDDSRAGKVAALRRELQSVVEELKLNKDLLEARLMEQLKEIDSKRAELDRLEQAVIRRALDDEQERRKYSDTRLEGTEFTEKTPEIPPKSPKREVRFTVPDSDNRCRCEDCGGSDVLM